MNISRFFMFLGAVFLVALVLYIVTVPKGSDIPLTGVVDGNEVIVSAKITGRIERLLVGEGAEVKAGQLVAELDTAELAAQRDSAAASIRSLEAQVTQGHRTEGWTADQPGATRPQGEATLPPTKANIEPPTPDRATNDRAIRGGWGLSK